MRTASNLKDCFVCGKKNIPYRWYCSNHFIPNFGVLMVHKIPDYIPVKQEYEYLRKLYRKNYENKKN